MGHRPLKPFSLLRISLTWAHYAEIPFTFDLSDNATPYAAQDNLGGLQESSVGDLYYHAFKVDLTGLAAGYNVHFDLY